MNLQARFFKKKLLSIIVLVIVVDSIFLTIPKLSLADDEKLNPLDSISLDELNRLLGKPIPNDKEFDENQVYNQDIDLSSYLQDYTNDYYQVFQPWKTRAAVRCIEISDDYQYMVVGGGYLYDNEIHIYRWNSLNNQYVKVWNSGDEIITEDVIDVDIADTDHNQFLEIVAASADGSFHVFEQKHIYDPTSNTENMFEHVYSSPYLGQVFGVEINDTDSDYNPDIVVVSWDNKVHVFEYTTHSGYPFAPEHWIDYEEKWTSTNMGQHPTSLVVGDTNANGLPDFVVGTREGGIFIFENNGTILDIHGQPYPLCQDNSYKLIYSDTSSIWAPIYAMDIGNLDGRIGDEVAIASFATNAYVLRYDHILEDYYLQKLIKGFEPWTLKDFYPADNWADNLIDGYRVYFNDPNAGFGTAVPEPISLSDPWFIKGNYPYNSGSLQNNITCMTLFDSSPTELTYAIYDFGADEEGTGNGNSRADFSIVFQTPYSTVDINDFEISISQDLRHWTKIDPSSISKGYSTEMFASLDIDVDSNMIANQWDYFQYVNVTVLKGSPDYRIYRLELHYVNARVDTALAVNIGTLASGTAPGDILPQILIGTVDGRIVSFIYNQLEDEFTLTWDSWVDDRFSLETNIWDLEQVKTLGTMPMIMGMTDLETDYQWVYDPSPKSQLGGLNIFDYDIENIDGDSLGDGDFIVTAEDGNVYFFDNEFNYISSKTSDYFTTINNRAQYNNKNLSISAANIWNHVNYPGSEILIGWYDESISNLYDDFYDDSSTTIPADIEFWYRSGGGNLYGNPTSLTDLEVTGQLEELLKTAQSIPSVDGIDIDDDGDIDLVVCVDNLYLLLNIGTSDLPQFTLDSDYFKDINEVQGKRKFFSPQFVEFDHDNDYDLIIGYSNRVGATYLENYGKVDDPEWTEKKELLNNFDEEAAINVYNLTRPLFVSYLDNSVSDTIQLSLTTGIDYSNRYLNFLMFDVYANNVHKFLIQYNMQTSFMVATNPVLSRLEVNSFKSEVTGDIYKYRNFGFRAIESWSTRLELYNWTLTVDTADIDQDGKGEIIVGDYDNNVYIFEHITNNTYKIAFRSPDMYQNYPTTESPYAWDQFGTFTGEFNQTIWNHVSHILVGVDLNKNGYLELVALAGTVFYIFETAYDEFDGRIIDDTYILVQKYDLLLSTEASYLKENSYLESTGLSWAKDLDLDGHSEIIVAFGAQLFVYVPTLGKVYELFGNVPPYTDSGHYNLPGNSLIYDNLSISGVQVFDTNQNGIEEIIIYGDIGREGWNEIGFLGIIEYNNIGYQIIWELPSNSLINNKIYTVEVADQDYDGKWELLIGGEKGISIWEYSNGTYEQISVVTGHLNYPHMQSYSFFGENNNYASDFQIPQRSHDIIQFIYSGTNHSYLAVWSEDKTGVGPIRLYQAISQDGENWHSVQALPLYNSFDMLFPSLVQIEDGTIYLIWTQLSLVALDIYGIFMMNSTNNGVSWSTPYVIFSDYGISDNPFRSPSVFSYSDKGFGFSFVYNNEVTSTAKFGFYNKNTGIITTPVTIQGLIDDEFFVNGIDVVEKPDNPETYAVSISAHRKSEDKDDYDIWFFELNSTLGFSIEPRKLIESPAVEHTPSIIYLRTGYYPLMITYDASGYMQAMSTSYGIVSSDYLEWSNPDILAVYPDYIIPDPIVHTSPTFKTLDDCRINSMGFRGPKIAPTFDGGFVLLTKFDIDGAELIPYQPLYWEDLLCQVYALNVSSFTALGKATDIAVGDSDGDGLNELLIADGIKVRLFELYSTKSGFHGYILKWKSKNYDSDVSDVSIYDTNGNNFDELIFSVQGEDVYVYETRDIFVDRIRIEVPLLAFTTFDTNHANYERSISLDINDDGYEDYIVVMETGEVYAFDGLSGLQEWQVLNSGEIQTLEIGNYENTIAIFLLYTNGDVYWLDKNDGNVLTTYNLSGSDTYIDKTLLYDYNSDSIDDIIAFTSDYELITYDGSDGFNLPYSEDFVDVSLRGITIAYESLTPYIILALNNDTIVGLDINLVEQWKFYVDNVDSDTRVFAKDLDGDQISEIFISSNPFILIYPNGTWIWDVTHTSFASSAFFFDINNDNVLDIIINGGNSEIASAYDGRNGKILWSYINNNFVSEELVVGKINNNVELFFSFYDLDSNFGVGSLSLLGTLNWITITTNDILNKPIELQSILVDGGLGVIFGNEGGEIKAITSEELIYEETEIDPLSSMNLEKIVSSNTYITKGTIVLGNFYGGDTPYLFYVENGTKAIVYDLLSRQILYSKDLSLRGNVTQVLAADLIGDGIPNAVYLRTNSFEFGIIDLTTMNYAQTHLGVNMVQVYDMISAPITGGVDSLVIAFHDISGNDRIRCLDWKGVYLWADITVSQEVKQLLAGHLLDVSGDNGNLLIVRLEDNLKLYTLSDGIHLRDVITGDVGLVEIGSHSDAISYNFIYFRYMNEIYCYDAENDLVVWQTELVSNAELLDIEIANIDVDAYYEIFISQNGTRLYQLDGLNGTIDAYHIHNSFETNQLEVLMDTTNNYRLLIKDYHRLFVQNVENEEILLATNNQFYKVTDLTLWPNDNLSNKTFFILLANNAIYAYNISEVFAFPLRNPGESYNINISKVLSMSIPASMMLITLITLLVMVSKKKKKVKLT